MRTYKINGVEVNVKKRSFSYSDKINERSTCSFVVNEPEFTIEIGMEVEITDDLDTVFKGTVDNLEEYSAKGAVEQITVKCVDFSQLIDKRIVYDTFTNEKAGDIVRSLLNNFFAEEGITEGTIQDGQEIQAAVFNYLDGNRAMNYVADAVGYNWYINENKELNFYSRETFKADTSLTDNSKNYYTFRIKKTRGKYRNRQYVRAGQDITSEIVKEKPTPAPDGTSKTFVTRFPIAEKPRIFIDDVEVNSVDIGINGLDKDKKWYWNKGTNNVVQDDTETVLDTETLEITYKGLYPILVVAENPEEITTRQAIEGGTGIHENVVQETNLDTREAALEFAKGKLEKYGIIPRIITFNTYENFRAGQLLNINITKYNLNDDFLVESVTARDEGVTTYTVKCLDGSAIGGWEQFFKSLIQSSKKMVIRENEILVLLNTIFETTGWTEQIQETVNACPVPSDDLYPADNLYPC